MYDDLGNKAGSKTTSHAERAVSELFILPRALQVPMELFAIPVRSPSYTQALLFRLIRESMQGVVTNRAWLMESGHDTTRHGIGQRPQFRHW